MEEGDEIKLMIWRAHFDERQLQEIDFSLLYANQFRHGTDGHNAKLIIAKMAKLLDRAYGEAKQDA